MITLRADDTMTMTATVIYETHFTAVHALPFVEAESQRHRHVYTLTVAVRGKVKPLQAHAQWNPDTGQWQATGSPNTGMVINRGQLQAAVNGAVGELTGMGYGLPETEACLNTRVSNPTLENLAHYLAGTIDVSLPSYAELRAVELSDGEFTVWIDRGDVSIAEAQV